MQTADPASLEIRVGNLPKSAADSQVRALFAAHGPILSYARPVDGRNMAPKSFAYLSMSPVEGTAAVKALHGKLFAGEILSVSADARLRQ